jgi:hypothetical protein
MAETVVGKIEDDTPAAGVQALVHPASIRSEQDRERENLTTRAYTRRIHVVGRKIRRITPRIDEVAGHAKPE